MITEWPDADNLLETALITLRQELLPQLPEQARYTGLMVANALSIVLRDLRGQAVREDAAAAVSALIGRNDSPALCSAIAAGTFDSPDREAALRHALMVITRARLSINNPKMLG